MVPHNDGSYCLRASTLREFMQANVDISKEARVTVYEKAEGSEGTAAKEGNFVHRSRDRDSTLGEGVEVGGFCVATAPHAGERRRFKAVLLGVRSSGVPLHVKFVGTEAGEPFTQLSAHLGLSRRAPSRQQPLAERRAAPV